MLISINQPPHASMHYTSTQQPLGRNSKQRKPRTEAVIFNLERRYYTTIMDLKLLFTLCLCALYCRVEAKLKEGDCEGEGMREKLCSWLLYKRLSQYIGDSLYSYSLCNINMYDRFYTTYEYYVFANSYCCFLLQYVLAS